MVVLCWDIELALACAAGEFETLRLHKGKTDFTESDIEESASGTLFVSSHGTRFSESFRCLPLAVGLCFSMGFHSVDAKERNRFVTPH